MRVCIITEGSYPYITGGVSSCILQLINAFEDIEFYIFAIATTKEEMPEPRCKIPKNVIKVQTVYVGEWVNPRFNFKGISRYDKDALQELVYDMGIFGDNFFRMRKYHKKHLPDVLNSKIFFDLCKKMCSDFNIQTPFIDFLWSMRSMYAPILCMLGAEFPKADIYHSISCGYAGVAGAFASYLNNKPLILSEHGIYTRERELDIIRNSTVPESLKLLWIDFFYKLSKLAYDRASIVTTLFEANKKMQLELGCPAEKIITVVNGVDVSKYSVCPVRKDGLTVGTILRVVPIKDVRMLIVAFSKVKKEIPQAKLEILGNCEEDKEYYKYCFKLCEDLKVEDVRFRGLVDINKFMPDLDVLVLSSLSEGQPLAMLEGMACGKPYVVTDVGCCMELVKDCGYCVPVMDSDAMADAIIKLLKNPELRQEMGLNGRNVVVNNYDLCIVLDTYKDLYKTLGR